MSDVIDWSKAPEGYPIWVENMMAFGERGGWHKELSDRFVDADGRYWPLDAVSRGSCKVHRPPQPATWSGEGLPPVGRKIENKSDYKGWSVVILHRHGAALVEQEDGVAADYVLIGKSLCFPARTPEQIAADERSKYCDRIYGVMCKAASPYNRSDMAEVLYDAGLRFTE